MLEFLVWVGWGGAWFNRKSIRDLDAKDLIRHRTRKPVETSYDEDHQAGRYGGDNY